MPQLKFFFPAIFLAFVICFSSCRHGCNGRENVVEEKKLPQIPAPDFNADSAYHFVQKQVEFGPRVPNTPEHVAAGNWLEEKLREYSDKIYLQEGQVEAFDGTKLNFKNIIASFNPEHKTRILLCAHWDTRPVADHDPDPERQDEPILGANDGGSGVGVLLEIARQLNLNPVTTVGVDIILFDVEDYGQPENSGLPYKNDSYCLGSQYWAKKPHLPNYRAKYGILLDMVGAKNSTFYMEMYSMKYAPSIMRRVWNNAAQLGYTQYFLFQQTKRPLIDDHYYINTIIGIPTIDIIYTSNDQPNLFGPTWHTHDDDMSIIDKNVLHAVGQTVLYTVRQEEAMGKQPL